MAPGARWLGSPLLLLEPPGLDWALGAPQGPELGLGPSNHLPRHAGSPGGAGGAAADSREPRPPFHLGPALWPHFLPVLSRQAGESGLGGQFTRKSSCGCGWGDPRHGCGVGRAPSPASLRALPDGLHEASAPLPTPCLPLPYLAEPSCLAGVPSQRSRCAGGPPTATSGSAILSLK